MVEMDYTRSFSANSFNICTFAGDISSYDECPATWELFGILAIVDWYLACLALIRYDNTGELIKLYDRFQGPINGEWWKMMEFDGAFFKSFGRPLFKIEVVQQ